jgi:hypothetical protein
VTILSLDDALRALAAVRATDAAPEASARSRVRPKGPVKALYAELEFRC